MRKTTENNGLADITAVRVNKDLPQSERVADFKRQIKDTSNYICETFVIHAKYATNGDKLEDALRGMMAL